MDKVRYRTEAFSGLQERAAAEVMAFETFELGNVDILETLVSGVLAGRSHEMVERCLQMIDELNRNGYVDDMGQMEKVGFFQEVLSEIERSTGVQVKYALWLADIETVTDREWYGRDMADDLVLILMKSARWFCLSLALTGRCMGTRKCRWRWKKSWRP